MKKQTFQFKCAFKTFIYLLLILLYPLNHLEAQSLATPTLTAPSVGSINNYPNVILDWSAVSGATAYEYKLSTNSNLSSVPSASVTASQVTTSNLLFNSTYYWQVRAIKTTLPSDSSQWSQVFNFSTVNQLTLVSPSNNSINQYPNALLDWDFITGITNYDYQIDTTSSFNSSILVYGSIAAGTSQINSSNLRFGTKYYWRVRARHAVDTTNWSQTYSFITIDEIALVSPINNANLQYPNALLDWDFITGITNYDYQIDTTSAFNSSIFVSGSIAAGTSQINSSNLRFGTKYYWRVRARHAVDTTNWSQVFNFTVIDQPLLISPSNGATGVSTNPTIDWDFITGTTNYQYQWDVTPNFTTAQTQTISSSTSQANLVGLNNGTTYYWRVRTWHAADTSNWSQTWSFFVGNPIGIKDINTNANEISIYPNPISNEATIVLANTTDINVNISLYSVEGKLVKTLNYKPIENKIKINRSELSAGIYYLHIMQESMENITLKIIVTD